MSITWCGGGAATEDCDSEGGVMPAAFETAAAILPSSCDSISVSGGGALAWLEGEGGTSCLSKLPGGGPEGGGPDGGGPAAGAGAEALVAVTGSLAFAADFSTGALGVSAGASVLARLRGRDRERFSAAASSPSLRRRLCRLRPDLDRLPCGAFVGGLHGPSAAAGGCQGPASSGLRAGGRQAPSCTGAAGGLQGCPSEAAGVETAGAARSCCSSSSTSARRFRRAESWCV
mmetsp:Transcript_26447/g.47728  ORF Transcript_26447/g.47728 Transcript_26447/m.47728 type:complete len:231 (-) Transcript_26447:207-899(-)